MFGAGVEFGAGLAVGFFVVELTLQEAWYRYSMRRLYGKWKQRKRPDEK